MSEDILAYASVLRLSRADLNILKIKDAYGLHKVVYGLFENTRSDAEKQGSVPSGIVTFAGVQGDFKGVVFVTQEP
jgi:CRISPR system Cascade subunit CasE